jgi:hypothetical protein
MSLSDLSNIGSFVSALAVLASLVYLGLQTRQNVRHTRALIQQGRAARISEAALRLCELTGEPGMDRCIDAAPDVTAADLRRFLFLCRAAFISAEDSWLQRREGLLDDAAFASFEAGVRGGLFGPGVDMAWKLTRNAYEPSFRDFMDRTLSAGSGPESGSNLERWKTLTAAPAQ